MVDKKECCGCTACMHICPVKCIEMKEDKEGFLYPAVDNEKCIHCRKCERVCPIKDKAVLGSPFQGSCLQSRLRGSRESRNYNDFSPSVTAKPCHLPRQREAKDGLSAQSDEKLINVFIGYNKNEEIREQSSSGGIFSLAAEWIINQNGVVFGAAFDENFEVCHIAAETKEQLSKLRGSKYVQSRMGNTYPLVKRYLENNCKVLFTGTACQIAGLKKYLSKDYENLYTLDVLCHGVPSPKIWKMYLDDKREQYNASIEKIEFRSKESGWKNFSVNIEFSDNRRYCVRFYEDVFMKLFLGNIDLRPSCYDCRFKGFPRISDMTIGDSWGIENYMPDMDDDRGASVIILNSLKGKQMLDEVRESLNVREANLDRALPITADSRKSVEMHPNRKRFFDGLGKGESIDTLCGYLRSNLLQRAVSFMRKILMRLSLKNSEVM